MATSFPGGLDTFVDPNGTTDTLESVPHDAQHSNANDAIEALEAKVGIDGSAVATSLDHLLKSSSVTDPGHLHTPGAVGADASGSASSALATATVRAFAHALMFGS